MEKKSVSGIVSVPSESTECAASKPFIMKIDPFLDDIESDEEHNASEEESAQVSRAAMTRNIWTQIEANQFTINVNVMPILKARLPDVLHTKFLKLFRKKAIDRTIVAEEEPENDVTEIDANVEAYIDRIAMYVLKHLTPYFESLGFKLKNASDDDDDDDDDDAAEINVNEEAFAVVFASELLKRLKVSVAQLLDREKKKKNVSGQDEKE